MLKYCDIQQFSVKQDGTTPIKWCTIIIAIKKAGSKKPQNKTKKHDSVYLKCKSISNFCFLQILPGFPPLKCFIFIVCCKQVEGKMVWCGILATYKISKFSLCLQITVKTDDYLLCLFFYFTVFIYLFIFTNSVKLCILFLRKGKFKTYFRKRLQCKSIKQ